MIAARPASRGTAPPARDARIAAKRFPVRLHLVESEQDALRASQRETLETAFALSTGQFARFTEPGYLDHGNQLEEAMEKHCRLRTELHSRFAMSCSCFFFVLLGSPFAILMARKQFLTSFLFCFTPILVVYYPVTMMTQNLSKTGQLDPAWAVWSANGLMLIASGYFFRRVLQH